MVNLTCILKINKLNVKNKTDKPLARLSKNKRHKIPNEWWKKDDETKYSIKHFVYLFSLNERRLEKKKPMPMSLLFLPRVFFLSLYILGSDI